MARFEINQPLVTKEPRILVDAGLRAGLHRFRLVVTDDQGQPLPDAALDRIGADLEGLYTALEARDLAAGSSLARRLFS